MALAGAIVMGPRIGKYVNGKAVAIPGHNLALNTIIEMIDAMTDAITVFT